MTVQNAILSRPRQFLLTMILLLLAAQMYLLFASFRDKRSIRIRLLYVLHAGISFAFFYLSMMIIVWERNYPGSGQPLPPVFAAYGDLPVSVSAAYIILSALLTAAAFTGMMNYKKNHLTLNAIKETMDLLPAGIAFGKKDGTIVFRNMAMNHLSRSMTGRALNRMESFRKAAGTGPEENSEESVQVEVPEATSVWQVNFRNLAVDGEELTQVTATDVTRQAAINRELEEKNAKLRELHMRLDIYNRHADRIIIEQELLNARMVVHNEVGNVLLESRHYLNDPDSFDEEMLLQALKNTNTYLLKEYEEDDTARDPLADALEMAEAIGVDVILGGVPPAEETQRMILASAINECATNTVKHADGNELRVEINNDRHGKKEIFMLQNNGKPPKEGIRESGGLKSLRTLVEKQGGSMQFVTFPAFQLVISLPTKKE